MKQCWLNFAPGTVTSSGIIHQHIIKPTIVHYISNVARINTSRKTVDSLSSRLCSTSRNIWNNTRPLTTVMLAKQKLSYRAFFIVCQLTTTAAVTPKIEAENEELPCSKQCCCPREKSLSSRILLLTFYFLLFLCTLCTVS